MALLADSSSYISTKPNRLDEPVSLSIITLADTTSPYSVNKSFKSSLVVAALNFATKRFIKIKRIKKIIKELNRSVVMAIHFSYEL
jgi:hypothetical protein